MKTIYAIRHQFGGIYTGVLFEEPPTPEQIAPIQRFLDAKHAGHGIGWMKVVPLLLCGAEIPGAPQTPQEGSGAAQLQPVTASGFVTVGDAPAGR